MLVLDHVSISVPSIDNAHPFYDAVMAALGVDKVYDRPVALGFGVRCSDVEDFHSCLAVYESTVPQQKACGSTEKKDSHKTPMKHI